MGTGWCLDLSHVPVTLWPCLLLGDLWGILPRASVPSGWVARAVLSTVRLGSMDEGWAVACWGAGGCGQRMNGLTGTHHTLRPV